MSTQWFSSFQKDLALPAPECPTQLIGEQAIVVVQGPFLHALSEFSRLIGRDLERERQIRRKKATIAEVLRNSIAPIQGDDQKVIPNLVVAERLDLVPVDDHSVFRHYLQFPN